MKNLVRGVLVALALTVAGVLPAAAANWGGTTIYIADHTGPLSDDWRVAEAVAIWDADPTLTLVHGTSCPAGAPCINIFDDSASPYPAMDPSWWGVTWYTVDAADHITSADIVLAYEDLAPAYNLCVVLHELGHALATMPHEYGGGASLISGSCDAQVAAGQYPTLPAIDSAYIAGEYADVAPVVTQPEPQPAPAKAHGKGRAPGQAKKNR